jgi:hypothetical protein
VAAARVGAMHGVGSQQGRFAVGDGEEMRGQRACREAMWDVERFVVV